MSYYVVGGSYHHLEHSQVGVNFLNFALTVPMALRTSALFVYEKSLFILFMIKREFRKSFSVRAKEVIITQELQMTISGTGKSNTESSLSAVPYIYYLQKIIIPPVIKE